MMPVLERVFPFLTWFGGYRRDNLRADMIAA